MSQMDRLKKVRAMMLVKHPFFASIMMSSIAPFSSGSDAVPAEAGGEVHEFPGTSPIEARERIAP